MLELDGSFGEGGGQILRSALSLAMCTGTPFRLNHIRAKRAKPGLLRQHLTAVVAAAEVCSAEVTGASIGSQALTFVPQRVRGGDYRFAIGTAGSCTLVLQTLLPALWQADAPSRVVVQGGTHNAMAPPFHFLQRVYLPLLQRMGINATLTLDRHGFYPAGGGQITLEVQPAAALAPLHLLERGARVNAYAESLIAGVPAHVAKRELATVGEDMNWQAEQLHIRQIHHEEGPGNVLMATVEYEHVSELFCGFGEKGVAAEAVARNMVQELRDYVGGHAVAGPHLADQLLLPLALAGAGSFTASGITPHTQTNIAVIEKFLPVEFTLADRDGASLVTVTR